MIKWKDVSEKTSFIIKYVDHWYGENCICVVMEYCSNGSLSEEIAKRVEDNLKFTEDVFYLIPLSFYFSLLIFPSGNKEIWRRNKFGT
jgi:serine/threonine protein kinase